MKELYSLTQIGFNANIGCYGIFTTPALATEFAITYAERDGEKYSEETIWDGFTKKIYCGKYIFEIWKHPIE